VENVGFYDWTGSGDLTSRARIRIKSLTRPDLTLTSRANNGFWMGDPQVAMSADSNSATVTITVNRPRGRPPR